MSKKKYNKECNQLDAMNRLAELEANEISINEFMGCDRPTGFINDLNNRIKSRNKKVATLSNDEPSAPSYDIEEAFNPLIFDEIEGVSDPHVIDTPSIDDTDGIHVSYNYNLGRIVIDDGIAPTVLSIPALEYVDLNSSVYTADYDADYIGDVCETLMRFTLINKHPFAIVTLDEYENLFRRYRNINTNKFFIVAISGHYCLYYISDSDHKTLMTLPDIFGLTDDVQRLKFWVNAATQSELGNVAFYRYNSNYVTAVKNLRGEDAVKRYLNLINNDSDTIFNAIGDINAHNEYDIYDDDVLERTVKTIYEELLDTDEDEDEDDENDTSSDNIDYNEFFPYEPIRDDDTDEGVDEDDNEEEDNENDTSSDNINYNEFSPYEPIRDDDTDEEIMEISADEIDFDINETSEETKIESLKSDNDGSMKLPIRHKK